MPATEQTWRDLRALHVVFGITSMIMLIATVWMLAADHNRPWKTYQREFQNIEAWSAQARIDEQQTDAFRQDLATAEAELAAARRTPLDPSLVSEFIAEAQSVREDQPAAALMEADVKVLSSAEATDEAKRNARESLLVRMRDLTGRVKFRADNLALETKTVRAELDKARADYEIAVGKGRPQEELDRLQAIFNAVERRLEGPKSAEAAGSDGTAGKAADLGVVGRLQRTKQHLEKLDSLLKTATAAEDAAAKKLAEKRGELETLHKALYERAPNFGKRVLSLPVLDAFGSPLKPDQIWLPQLTLNNNFKDVARFDRCTTCHLAMDKTQPGSAVVPGYLPEREWKLELATPARDKAQEQLQAVATALEQEDAKVSESGGEKKSAWDRTNDRLRAIYGMRLSEEGLLSAGDVTVSVVLPQTAAAEAGLMSGDVLLEVGDARVNRENVASALLETPSWGKPLQLTIRRGLPHPYSSHPRLDLFVGSLSPHPMQKFGCTICHQGQGSSTSFEWASHMPNSVGQGEDWAREYGWFNNHHWIFPMYPERFAESSCLKCHHQVVELDASERFPDPPAPKLVEGYRLIESYGCYGCHEINGYDGPNKRIGPDLRNEPNFSPAAAQLLADPNLGKVSGEATALAREVVSHPDDDSARRRLLELIQTDLKSDSPQLNANSQRMEPLLRDVEAPGKLRRAGPSLRYVARKLSFEFLYDWIREPQHFRPTTKMPRFFGLTDHLDGAGLAASEEFEPIEIQGIAQYLLGASQKFDYLEPAQDTASASAERGKKVFQVRGCLACHAHGDFPQGTADQGPDLSRVGAKLRLTGEGNGRRWLYSWVREPNRYHARTVMPDTKLEPQQGEDGKWTDPALDVVEYLMTSPANFVGENQFWSPKPVAPLNVASLDRLVLSHLKDKYPVVRAEQIAREGLPPATGIKGDETALVGMTAETAVAQKLDYIGRRTISKYGCFGCHDIPGFEDAKPIGTGLADWGRKDPSRLAFENIITYLSQAHGQNSHKGNGGAGGGNHSGGAASSDHGPNGAAANGAASNGDSAAAEGGEDRSSPFALVRPAAPPTPTEVAKDVAFYHEHIESHEREGFIWQKLNEPRSYDYKKTENKKYNERLRMPKFYFNQDPVKNQQAIESIITFVLGLVAEPPAAQYIYNPPPREEAILAGKQILEKFNCGGCHALRMDEWTLNFKPGAIKDPKPLPVPDFPFLDPHFTAAEVTASKTLDKRGRLTARITGAPTRSTEDGSILIVDKDRQPFDPEDPEVSPHYLFWLYKPALIDGKAHRVGVEDLLIPVEALARRDEGRGAPAAYPSWGGYLPNLIYADVIADAKKINPNAKGEEAWGWLPPPLSGEGYKAQTQWLHDFLLDPYPIRSAVVLRMPKFNMSSAEAQALANYFAAVDKATFPYEFDPRTRTGYLEAAERERPDRLSSALKIVADNTYCVQCHHVGDYHPAGNPTGHGPQLNLVHQRLRPEYLREWIGNPKHFLPYTGMPVNVQYGKPVKAELFPGLEGVAGSVPSGLKELENMAAQLLVRLAPPGGRPSVEQARATISKQTEIIAQAVRDERQSANMPPPTNVEVEQAVAAEMQKRVANPVELLSQEQREALSIEQLDALVDLLMNFDQYSKQQFSIKPLIKPAATAPETGGADSPAATPTDGGAAGENRAAPAPN